jgi:integrase
MPAMDADLSPSSQSALALGAAASIDAALAARLTDLFIRGTPPNTLRAYERDLVYIDAWRRLAFSEGLQWPEREDVALRFVVDHAEDLSQSAPETAARRVAEAMIDRGLRKSLARPAPATLDRRIASWRAFHGFRNLASPFEAPILRRARAAARRAAAHRPAPKAARPIDRELLERLVEACGPGLRGTRDRALLEFGWASGGRRRSEIAALHVADLDLSGFDREQTVRIRLLSTKTTAAGATPTLLLVGRSARALVAWLDAGKIKDGAVFRAISKADRALDRALSAAGVRDVLAAIMDRAGFGRGHSSPHGLRSGFLTQASRDGVPLQAAARLSLHRSIVQAAQYYQDVELADNPATRIR